MNKEEIRKQFELNVIKDSKANGDSESCTNALIQRHKNGKYLYAWQEDNFKAFCVGYQAALASKQEKEWLLKSTQNLAVHLWEKHYKAESPVFEVLDNLAGVISQIDNMTTGLVRKQEHIESNQDAIEELLTSSSSMLGWCERNVHQWEFSQYNYLHDAVEKVKKLLTHQPKAIEPYAWYIGALNAFTTNRDEMLKMSKNYPVTPLYK